MITKQALGSLLFGMADILRDKVEDYKSYILSLLFFKRLSDNYQWEIENGKEKFLATNCREPSEKELEVITKKMHDFVIPQGCFWEDVRKAPIDKKNEALDNAVAAIANQNVDQNGKYILKGIINTVRWNEPAPDGSGGKKLDPEVLSNLINYLGAVDLSNKNVTVDILGDAYEYLIKRFADENKGGTMAGQFYTPQEVVDIVVRYLKPEPGNTIYDPTCGSGSLLLRTARGGNADEIFGQEKNPTTFNLARMNMLLHGVKYKDFDIQNGDTLEKDEFGDRQFDAVVANPPFSAEWSADAKFNNDDRFSKAGVLAPKSKADYAFILHMIYHLNDGGTMACVAPHGVLFRGAAEGKIRQFLIEKKNYIDAIIGLPANIFYGTSIPTCILVMKKCRKEDDNILFIDASKEFEKVKTQNKLRQEHIDKIVSTYRERKEIEKYSHCATLQEIKDNDYNLNIPRYVDTFEEEEEIDIKAVMSEIKELEAKRAELDAQIDVYLKELGII